MSKSLINIANKHDRTVVLVDMDCFYCQVEEKLDPSLKGKPIAVVQYNAWKGGGIIAVNYAARDRGVTRHMRGDQAKEHCPEIELVKVPSVRDKADLTKYREAGKDVASVLQRFTAQLERASVDEAYLDITENVKKRFKEMNDGHFVLTPDKLMNCYAVGYENIGDFIQNLSKKVTFRRNAADNGNGRNEDEQEKLYTKYDIRLLIGASIVNEIREAVKKETGFECSAGIAHNKILAKLVCGMNKPNKQTVLPVKNVSELFRLWLFQMARGIDLEAVTPRFASKSIGCCKKFPGRNSIKGIATLTHWLTELAKEIVERLEKDEIENSRVAKQIVVSFTQQFTGEEVASTRCVPLSVIDVEIIVQDALDVIKKNTAVFFRSEQNTVIVNPITLLGISASKFDDSNQQKKNTIKDMFSKAIVADAVKKTANESKDNTEHLHPANPKSDTKSSNIKSFFTASKDEATEMDEIGPPTDDEFNCNSNSSMDGFAIAAVDPMPIQDTESPAPAFPSVSSDVDERVGTTSTSMPTPNSSSVDHAVRDDEPPGPSNRPDYRATYVEFLRPEIPDEFFENCSQCNQKLLIVELQSHMDMHLAYQISQEQRMEFRSQSKHKPTSSSSSSSPPIAKKPKLDRSTHLNSSSSGGSGSKVMTRNTDTSSSGSNGMGALTRYLVQKNDFNVPASSVKCDECGKFIQIESVAEHSDYHTARKLQLEINSSMNASAVIGSASSKNAKTKSKTDSTSKKRSIASFFRTTN